MEMVGHQGDSGVRPRGLGMGASSELRGMGIEMKGEMGKRDCQEGGREMEHLLVMWGSKRLRSWTHGEG